MTAAMTGTMTGIATRSPVSRCVTLLAQCSELVHARVCRRDDYDRRRDDYDRRDDRRY